MPGERTEPSTVIEKRVDAILTLTVREIEQNLNGMQYHSTAETRATEEEVNRTAKAILSGNSLEFELLRQACTRWVDAARQKPALFEGSSK